MAARFEDQPIVVTFEPGQWHLVARDLVYSATSVEAYLNDLVNAANPRQDAWVLASAQRLQEVVRVLDGVVEVLAEAHGRPSPPL
jgi:hypothetical protein